jgi:hypothetical protein
MNNIKQEIKQEQEELLFNSIYQEQEVVPKPKKIDHAPLLRLCIVILSLILFIIILITLLKK